MGGNGTKRGGQKCPRPCLQWVQANDMKIQMMGRSVANLIILVFSTTHRESWQGKKNTPQGCSALQRAYAVPSI